MEAERSAIGRLWLAFGERRLERVKAHLRGVVRGEVRRYELPNIGALNFVLEHALSGGVTPSLALDAHDKSLSAALLDIDIAPPG